MGVRVALIGRGVVGDRIAQRAALVLPELDLVEVDTRTSSSAPSGLDPAGWDALRVDAAVLAGPAPHAPIARELLTRGIAVVSVSDQLGDVSELLALDDLALGGDTTVVIGAGMEPGLAGLIARHLADQLASCDEIHIAAHGTAGPACARQHHRALAGRAVGLHDGEWIERRGGSGRELCWFPEPVGAYDCYRAELASPLLLREVFPEVSRISARMSATRRDRLTARLPMLRRPHREGGVGALRVEVRGADRHGARTTLVSGIAELAGTAAAATATALLHAVVTRALPTGVVSSGDRRIDTVATLHVVERLGVRLQEFTGVPSTLMPTTPMPATHLEVPT